MRLALLVATNWPGHAHEPFLAGLSGRNCIPISPASAKYFPCKLLPASVPQQRIVSDNTAPVVREKAEPPRMNVGQ